MPAIGSVELNAMLSPGIAIVARARPIELNDAIL